MTGRRRTRPAEPVECTCKIARHEHGSTGMYAQHKCGCDTCHVAEAVRRRVRNGTAPEPDLAPSDGPGTPGLFVATFPYFGGISPQRLRRILRMEVAALAEAQGVRLLPGELVVRTDRTGAGVFVSVAIDAESVRPLAEVQQRAAELAWRHEQAHPQLARAISRTIEEVAA